MDEKADLRSEGITPNTLTEGIISYKKSFIKITFFKNHDLI